MDNNKKVTCPRCNGSGMQEEKTTKIVDGAVRKDSMFLTCQKCSGTGKIEEKDLEKP